MISIRPTDADGRCTGTGGGKGSIVLLSIPHHERDRERRKEERKGRRERGREREREGGKGNPFTGKRWQSVQGGLDSTLIRGPPGAMPATVVAWHESWVESAKIRNWLPVILVRK